MTDTPFTLRRGTPADLDAIVAFNAAMAQETEGRTLPGATLRSGVQRALDDPQRASYFLAERDGAIIGQLMVTLEWSDWRNGWFWWIQSVYVRPEHRRTGVYAGLHRHVEGQAREAGDVIGLRLYVDRDNAHAMRVYERMQMRETHYALFETDWSATPSR